MIDILFFACLGLYGAAALTGFSGHVIKNDKALSASWRIFLGAFAFHMAYFAARGIIAERLPMSNQFEFAMSFALGVSVFYIFMKVRLRLDWISAYALPVIFLLLTYAAFLPREIKDLMPALRSQWFGLHIGAAVIAYAAFVLAACIGVKYLIELRKSQNESDANLRQADYLSYRLISLGLLMLTVVILSGAIWAEEAWSSFWSWDPKELWSLITWIVYAIYLHQRLRMKWQGKRMAVLSIIAAGVVLFTFIGVNTLLSGLHSYI